MNNITTPFTSSTATRSGADLFRQEPDDFLDEPDEVEIVQPFTSSTAYGVMP